MTGKLEEALIGLGVIIVVALTNYISSKLAARKAVVASEKAIVVSEEAVTASKQAVTASQQTFESVTQNNGGSSVKDSLDRIEDGNRWLDTRLDRVVDIVDRLAIEQRQTNIKLDDHIREHNHEGN